MRHAFTSTDKTQSLTIHMAPGGGFVIKIIKQPKVVIESEIDITDDVTATAANPVPAK